MFQSLEFLAADSRKSRLSVAAVVAAEPVKFVGRNVKYLFIFIFYNDVLVGEIACGDEFSTETSAYAVHLMHDVVAHLRHGKYLRRLLFFLSADARNILSAYHRDLGFGIYKSLGYLSCEYEDTCTSAVYVVCDAAPHFFIHQIISQRLRRRLVAHTDHSGVSRLVKRPQIIEQCVVMHGIVAQSVTRHVDYLLRREYRIGGSEKTEPHFLNAAEFLHHAVDVEYRLDMFFERVARFGKLPYSAAMLFDVKTQLLVRQPGIVEYHRRIIGQKVEYTAHALLDKRQKPLHLLSTYA